MTARLAGVADGPATARATSRPGAAIARVIGVVAVANEAVVVLAVALDLVVTFANTVERYLFRTSILWNQDASLVALSAITFMGAAAALRRGSTLSFDYVLDRLSGWWRRFATALGLWAVVGVAAATLVVFPYYFQQVSLQQLLALHVSEGWAAIWMGAGYALLVLYAAERLARTGLGAAAAALAVAGLAALGAHAWGDLQLSAAAGVDPFVLVVVAIAVAFTTGVPIALVLGVGSLTYMLTSGQMPLVSVPLAFARGISSYLLLAVPFFMIAGVLMTATGMARRIVDAAAAWVGHWPGGLLVAQIGAMYLFSGMSGSKIADVAAVGAVMREPLRERGYRPSESVAVLAAAGAMGETVPPAIVMVVLGSITTLSVGALFLAGGLPAVVLALALVGGVLVRARGGRLPSGAAFELGSALRSVRGAVPALLLPAILVGGIVFGVGTPTEVSSFAVVYGLVVSAVAYRSLRPGTLWELLRNASITSGMVLLVASTASLFAQAFSFDGLAQAVTSFMAGLGGRLGFTAASAVVLLVLGSVLEGLPALLIFGPILLPIATHLGVNPLHYGIVLIMSMGIGTFAPPVGVGLFFANAVGGARFEETFRPSLFYNAMLLVGLAVVVAVPDITLVVPRLFGFR